LFNAHRDEYGLLSIMAFDGEDRTATAKRRRSGCLHDGGVVAPYVLDGLVKGALSVAYVEQQVASNSGRGGVLIMGNLPVHKAAGVRNVLEAAENGSAFPGSLQPRPRPLSGRCHPGLVDDNGRDAA